MMLRSRSIVLVVFVGLASGPSTGEAQPSFPPLSGRVVDAAEVLDPAAEQRLTELLTAHERATAQQLVVATVPSLQGLTIEEFAYQLGRAWGIGRAGADNGLVFLTAPAERATRIETGYGLEAELPDALAATIIQSAVLPQFRQGDLQGGIEAGARAIVDALGGPAMTGGDWQRPAAQPRGDAGGSAPTALGFGLWLLFILLAFVVSRRQRGRRLARRGPWGGRRGIVWGGFPIGGRGGWSGGSGGGGGFSGGGGSFGGGGASGRW